MSVNLSLDHSFTMNHYRSVLILFLVLFLIPLTVSYNILVIFPHPGKSHFLSYVGLFKALAQKGHQMTVISHFPLMKPVENYKDVEIGGLETFNYSKPDYFTNLRNYETPSRFAMYFTSLVLAEIGQLACEKGFSSQTVQDFLKGSHQFDLIIMEYFNSDCFLTIAKKFNVPIVRVHSCTLMPWTSTRYSNPNNPAYVPNNFMPFSDKMTFLERVENTLLNLFHSTYYNKYVVINSDKRVSMKYFGELGATMHSDVLNDSLLLVASHYSLNLPRPLVPSVIEVGGIHVGKPNSLATVRYLQIAS